MADDVKIIISAIDKASAELQKVKNSLGNVDSAAKQAAGGTGVLSKATGGLKDLMGGLGVSMPVLGVAAFGTAIAGATAYVKGAVTDTAAYAEEVRQLGMAIGATPEEASKLIQAADDMGISFAQLETAMKGAIRKGVEPTIAGMGQLADQYLAIQDPIERTKFLMDNFGRSGADLQRLMELGADGIRELGDEIEGTARLMDQDALDAAEEYRLAMDGLGDTFEDIKMTIGRAFIPAMAAAANAIADFMNRERELQTKQRKTSDFILETATSYEEYAAQMTAFAESQHLVVRATEDGIQAFDTSSGLANKLAENVDILSEAEYELYLRNIYLAASYEANKKPVEDFSEAIDDSTEVIDETKQALDDLHAAMNGKLGPAIDDFQTGMVDLEGQAETLKKRIGELSAIPVVTPEQAAQIEGLRNKLYETTVKIKEAETALSEGEWSKKKKLAAEENLESLKLEAIELAGEIEALGGKSYLTEAQKTELAELQGELGKVEADIKATADAHAEATGRILWDIAQQKLATNDARTEVSEFTEDELKLLGGLAEQWGLVDDATVAASLGMDEAMRAFAEGDVKRAMEIISAMYLKLTTMPTDLAINIKVNTSGTIPNIGGPVGGTGGTKVVPKGPGGSVAPPPPSSNSGPGGANGLDFVVPPGYPNDSYPIRVQSGEHVLVTPAGQKSTGGGTTYVMNITTSAPVEPIIRDFELMRALALGG